YIGTPGYYDYTVSDDGTPRSFGTRRRSYSTDVFTRQAISFLKASTKTPRRPFFLWLAYNAPHGSHSSFRPCRFQTSAVPPDPAARQWLPTTTSLRPCSTTPVDISVRSRPVPARTTAGEWTGATSARCWAAAEAGRLIAGRSSSSTPVARATTRCAPTATSTP